MPSLFKVLELLGSDAERRKLLNELATTRTLEEYFGVLVRYAEKG